MPYNPPVTIIAGKGLSTSYSSLTQIGGILPGSGFGSAAIQLYANVTNGNLVVHDHVLSVMEQNGPLNFGYVYNSQATNPENPWHFAVVSRLLTLPSTTRPFGTEARMLEIDGHETRYLQKEGQPLYYFAPGHTNGTPYLTYRYDLSRWEHYHSGTRETNYYDNNGLLCSHQDAKGRQTLYEYDQGTLTAIVGPSGIRYEIRVNGLLRSIYQVMDGHELLLISSLFDTFNRLVTTLIPASLPLLQGYEITYTYRGNLPNLTSIKQSDNTCLTLFYQGELNYDKIKRVVAGSLVIADGVTTTSFSFDSPTEVSIRTVDYGTTKLQLDEQGRLISVIQPQGLGSSISEVDKTQYAYATTGQVNAITHLNGGIERFVYDDFFGLLREHHQPLGQVTKYSYDACFSTQQCTSQSVYLNATDSLTTRFVYDPDHDGLQQQHIALRFSISPEKRVTEHRVDVFGSVTSTRCYLNKRFTSYATAPILAEMLDWVKEQNPQAITLSEFSYDCRGQLASITRYADIDTQGNGIDNAHTSKETFFRNDAGNCLIHTVRQQSGEAKETHQYDGLERLITASDFLGTTTEHTYEECKHTVTVNTGTQTRTVIYQRDAKDKLVSQKETVTDGLNTETRLTRYDFLMSERPIITLLPDGRRLIHFWDLAQNPILSISATRFATLTTHNRTYNYQSTIRISTPSDLGLEPL